MNDISVDILRNLKYNGNNGIRTPFSCLLTGGAIGEG